MPQPALRKLVAAYTRARSEGDDARALALLAKLARAEPREPRWPKRTAEIHARAGQREAELTALRRALELQLDAEQTTRAIATAKRIVALDPDDLATRDRLDLLYMVPGDAGASSSGQPLAEAAGDAEELVLTEVIEGARPVALGELDERSAAEIPIDSGEPNAFVEAWDDPGQPDSRAMRDEQALRAKLLKQLPAREIEALLAQCPTQEFEAGAMCIRQGEPADCLYVILDGALIPFVEDPDADPSEIEMETLEAGDFCGEIGLFTKRPRNASLRAVAKTRVLRIERDLVRGLLRRHREIFRLVLRTLRLRLIDRLTRTHALFACFEHSVRAQVASQFKLIEVRDGGTVIQEGFPDPGLFVVLAGTVEVRQSSHGEDKVLARLEPCEVLGELSALYGQPAVASAAAVGTCWLLHLSAARFRKVLDRNPRVRALLAELGEARERENRGRYGEGNA